MAQTQRPLSPHLQVYKMYLTMVVSMGHRLAGLALGFGTLWLACWLGAAAAGPEAFATVQAFSGSWLGRLMLFGFTVSLFHHLLNGIRHLFWDLGWGFELPAVEAGAWLVLLGGIALSLLSWVLGYMTLGAL